MANGTTSNKNLQLTVIDLGPNKIQDIVGRTKRFLEKSEESGGIILDFSRIKDIDMIGITFVLGLYRLAVKYNRNFKIIKMDPFVYQIFKENGLHSKFYIDRSNA